MWCVTQAGFKTDKEQKDILSCLLSDEVCGYGKMSPEASADDTRLVIIAGRYCLPFPMLCSFLQPSIALCLLLTQRYDLRRPLLSLLLPCSPSHHLRQTAHHTFIRIPFWTMEPPHTHPLPRRSNQRNSTPATSCPLRSCPYHPKRRSDYRRNFYSRRYPR
jgi:hypothetical protein